MPRRLAIPAPLHRANRLFSFCRKAATVAAVTVTLFGIAFSGTSFAADQFFAGDGSALTASKWGASGGGPFTDAFSDGNTAQFGIVNGTGTGGSIIVGGIVATENFTLSGPSGTISNQSNGIVTIDVASGKTLDFGTQSFTSSATAGYIKNNSGVLALAGNTYGGGFTLNAGTVILRSVNAMGGSATNTLTINGGTIASDVNRVMTNKFAGGITVGGNFQLGDTGGLASSSASLTFTNVTSLGAATRTITLGNSGVNTFGGVLSGASGTGLIVAANANGTGGTLLLTGANTYDGGSAINGGRLQFGKINSMPNTGAVTVSGGASLGVNAGGTNEWTNGTSGGGTLGGLIDGTGGLGGANQVTWTANSNLAIDTSTATGGTFTYGGVGVIGGFHTASGPTDAISLTKLGTNTLVLGSANTFTGGVTLVNGTLGIGDDNALGTGKLTLSGSGALDPAGGNRTVANPIDMNSGPVFNDAVNQFTFTGPVNVINSALSVPSRTVNMSVAGTVTFGASPGSSTITLGNPTSNGGDNVGKTLLFSAASGGTIIVHDVLQDPTSGGGAASGAVNFSGTGTIQVDAQNTYSGGGTLSGAQTTLVIGSSSTGTSGPVGTGTLTVGSTVSTAPRIQASGAQTVSNGIALTGAGNSGVRIQGPDNLTLSGVISGSGTNGITKVDGGTLTLTNGNTYAGVTNIIGGTLLANNGSGTGTGSGNITVGNGTANSGTFGGTGAVTGGVTVNNGGTLSPGAASISKFAIGGLTLNSGSTLAYEINSDVSLAAAADRLNVSGALTIATSGAILSFSDAGSTTLSPGSKLTLIGYTGTWNGKTFDTYADDSTITVGANQYVLNYNDTSGGDNFVGGSFTKFVTLTAVPEANAFWLGGAVCSVLGLVAGTRKVRGKRGAA